MFSGFAPLTANFTPAPNQFFDLILHEEDCVVKVVGHLIRATLGWEDPRTKARRVEVSLPMSEFMRRGMSRNSVRKGLDLAMERGYVLKTAEETPRSAARYALRWDDQESQREAVRRERRANGERGSNFDRVKFCTVRGSNFDPPNVIRSKKKTKKKQEKTLNVSEGIDVFCPAAVPDRRTSPAEISERPPTAEDAQQSAAGTDYLAQEALALAEELRDLGSERRHRQLLGVCEARGLTDLARQALTATRRRLAQEGKRGVLEKPGAYYQSTLLKLLEERQVFVPAAVALQGGDDPAEVRQLVRASLGLAQERHDQSSVPIAVERSSEFGTPPERVQ